MNHDQAQPSDQGRTQDADSSPNDHNHRWRIAEQGSASSMGTCRCGASRPFFNGWADERDGWHATARARASNQRRWSHASQGGPDVR